MTRDFGRNKDLFPNVAYAGPTMYGRWQATTHKRGGGQEREFIGDLCVALRHRWIPNELFVIFTSYFDETNTHGPSPNVILVSHLGHAYQWRRFEKKLERLKKLHGFKVFHAKEFKPRSGEFTGWSDVQCSNLVADLSHLAQTTLTEGFLVSLTRERYENEYRAPPIPKKMNLDSQYGVCFRACLQHLIAFLETRNFRDRLNIIMENGHPNVDNCRVIFDEIKTQLLAANLDVFGSFAIEKKETCLPLMICDFLAGSYLIMKDAEKVGFARFIDQFPAPDGKGATLSFLELKPDALIKLKEGHEKWKQLKMDAWRTNRDARKAALQVRYS